MAKTETTETATAPAVNITFEDYVAPAKEPSQYAPLVESLINAGPEKVAKAILADEETATAFLREVQRAASDVDKSAVKRYLRPATKEEGSGFAIGVSVRAKITRNRKPADEATAEVTETAAA